VTVVGLNALYRFRLAEDPQFPRGRFQPYLGMGVGAFIADQLPGHIQQLPQPRLLGETAAGFGGWGSRHGVSVQGC